MEQNPVMSIGRTRGRLQSKNARIFPPVCLLGVGRHKCAEQGKKSSAPILPVKRRIKHCQAKRSVTFAETPSATCPSIMWDQPLGRSMKNMRSPPSFQGGRHPPLKRRHLSTFAQETICPPGSAAWDKWKWVAFTPRPGVRNVREEKKRRIHAEVCSAGALIPQRHPTSALSERVRKNFSFFFCVGERSKLFQFVPATSSADPLPAFSNWPPVFLGDHGVSKKIQGAIDAIHRPALKVIHEGKIAISSAISDLRLNEQNGTYPRNGPSICGRSWPVGKSGEIVHNMSGVAGISRHRIRPWRRWLLRRRREIWAPVGDFSAADLVARLFQGLRSFLGLFSKPKDFGMRPRYGARLHPTASVRDLGQRRTQNRGPAGRRFSGPGFLQ